MTVPRRYTGTARATRASAAGRLHVRPPRPRGPLHVLAGQPYANCDDDDAEIRRYLDAVAEHPCGPHQCHGRLEIDEGRHARRGHALEQRPPFQHTGLAVVLQGLVRPRLRGTELEFWRNSEEARTDRPSQQLRSLNGEWRLMRYFLLTHLCGISHRIWCTLSTICSDAA